MDCEKFDSLLIDALYDELDEVTHAAMKRHAEGCARCAGALAGLKATRDVGVVPIEEPSDGFEDRILEAAFAAHKSSPWPRKVLRALAWAGSHAMRPQLAMAALFFLVIGSSLLLLRAKPGTVAVVPVRVTEHGAPSLEEEPKTAAMDPNAAAFRGGQARPEAPAATAEGRARAAATPADDKAAEADGKDAEHADDPAKAALADARASRDASGCSAAIPKFDAVGAKYPGTSAAADAMWEEASCYKQSGDSAKARDLWLALRGSSSYGARANAELEAEATRGTLANAQAAANAAPAQPAQVAVAGKAAGPPATIPPSGSSTIALEGDRSEKAPASKTKAGESTTGKKAAAAPSPSPPKDVTKPSQPSY